MSCKIGHWCPSAMLFKASRVTYLHRQIVVWCRRPIEKLSALPQCGWDTNESTSSQHQASQLCMLAWCICISGGGSPGLGFGLRHFFSQWRLLPGKHKLRYRPCHLADQRRRRVGPKPRPGAADQRVLRRRKATRHSQQSRPPHRYRRRGCSTRPSRRRSSGSSD